MKLAVMQPYLFPYLGYFQLMKAVDCFILYDDVQYIEQGWINRNRILINGKPKFFSFSVKSQSHELPICERYFDDKALRDISKLRKSLKYSYGSAPHFDDVFPRIDTILNFIASNINESIGYLVAHSLSSLRDYLGISTELKISSELDIASNLSGQDRVVKIAKTMEANTYINMKGGRHLYDFDRFQSHGISLEFLEPVISKYRQLKDPFVGALSIIDVMMFNDLSEIKFYLKQYKLQND